MDLVALAQENEQLVTDLSTSLGRASEAARKGTRHFAPGALDGAVLPARGPGVSVEVTDETTSAAGRRLLREGGEAPTLLNFASGKRPGGGYLRGARAQEEDLCRLSALHSCLQEAPEFYASNREAGPVYTDSVILSPQVPFFRLEDLRIARRHVLMSVATCPAPDLSNGSPVPPFELGQLWRSRARRVLVAMALSSGEAVLGAWGCGVFGNDPSLVAAVLRAALDEPVLRHAFTRVVFAVPGSSSSNHLAFAQAFS